MVGGEDRGVQARLRRLSASLLVSWKPRMFHGLTNNLGRFAGRANVWLNPVSRR